MSKVREILEKVIYWYEKDLSVGGLSVLMEEIKEELEKPETEIECAGVSRVSTDGGHYYIEPRGNVWLPDGTMVYAEPPKREPLSDDEIMNLAIKSASDQIGEEFNKDELSKDDWKHLIYFARYIEKAHGVGE